MKSSENRSSSLIRSKSWRRSLLEKCPYSEFFWSVLSCIRSEYGEIWSIFPFSTRMGGDMDQKNSEYGHFLRSGFLSRKVLWEPNNEFYKELLLNNHVLIIVIRCIHTWQKNKVEVQFTWYSNLMFILFAFISSLYVENC